MQQNQQADKAKGPKKEKKLSDAKQDLLPDVARATSILIEGKTEEAIRISFNALLENKEELGGEGSILLLPGYFILAEANIMEGKLKKAEEVLIVAYWNFIK